MDFQHLSHVEIRQICYFIALVQSDNNVTEAARRLGIKKPPLTQRIQALEAWLSADLKMFDVKLFDRSKRPMVLTAAGTVFLAEAQQALMHLDRAIFQARQASQGHIGRLVIGMTKVIQLCRNTGFEPNIVQTVTVSGAVTLLSLVAAGIGLSILPNHVQTLQRTGVVYRPIQNVGLTRQIAVVWRQDDSSVVLSNFLKIIQDLMG